MTAGNEHAMDVISDETLVRKLYELSFSGADMRSAGAAQVEAAVYRRLFAAYGEELPENRERMAA